MTKHEHDKKRRTQENTNSCETMPLTTSSRRRPSAGAAVAFSAAFVATFVAPPVVSSFSPGGRPLSPTTTTRFPSSFSSSVVRNSPAGWSTTTKLLRSVRTTSSSSLSMVVERLSDEAVSAVTTSQLESAKLGLSELTNEMLLVGAVARPERAEGTLNRFGIAYDDVRNAAIAQVLPGGGAGAPSPLGGGDEAAGATAIPFGESTKATLNLACSIADRFASKTVRTEHVLLALLEYNYGTAATKNPDGMTSDCPALNVLLKSKGSVDRSNFDAFRFCDALLDDLLRLPEPDDEKADDDASGGKTTTIEEVVVVGGIDPGSTPTLNEVGIDLTALASEGKLDVVYGRNDEIRMCLRTLGRRRKNNPCLIGEPGVGKTSVAEGVAQVIASASMSTAQEKELRERKAREREGFDLNPFKQRSEDELRQEEDLQQASPVDEIASDLPPCPKCLLNHRVVSVELASLVAGTRNRGDFEERVQKLIKEVASTPTILFVDEIHAIIGTGGSGDGGGTNAANLLKPALARGDLRILGATTTPEYRKYIEKDGALERRFQPITVKEPSVEETLDILEAISARYEEYHDVLYRRNALEAAAKLSDRYLNDRFLPDKAIDLIDEAGSMIKMMEDDDVSTTYDPDDPESPIALVTEDDVAKVVSELSGIPVGKLETGEKERLRNIEVEMKKRIKGQDRAVRAVAKSIRRARAGLRDGRRPVASFLFCGPTGVGKTELCKSLAETYYGREKDMIRIDMSEYMERHTTSRLVGSPPGYVGYDEGGQLTEAIRRSPHSVVLLDELEKAHEDVLNVLLQIMDEGQLTDGKGRTVSFKNSVFVMTSNVGSQKILQMSRGNDSTEEALAMASVVKEELEATMKPELLNRIDEIVVFSPLRYDDLRSIAQGLVNEIVSRAYDEGKMTLSVTDRLVNKVTEEGCRDASKFGARPMRRAARSYLEDTVSEAITSDFLNEGDEAVVDLADASEVPGGQSDMDRGTVKITKVANGMSMESFLVKVEDDAGIGNVEEDSEWDDAANRPIPETFFE